MKNLLRKVRGGTRDVVLGGDALRHPYSDQPDKAFWKHAVSGRDGSTLKDLAPPVADIETARVATAGSCFAQHIGKALRARGANYMDLEPRPPLLGPKRGQALGYGQFSCRYGNIYTTRQLVQLFEEAFGRRRPREAVWMKDGKAFDTLRPGLQPRGFASAEEVGVIRKAHLARVREMFETLDLFVFTLGLTETWASRADGTVFPSAPGVIAGTYDPSAHAFVNLTYPDVLEDLERFRKLLHQVNTAARILLTVSPVPLAATATDQHVLVATTHSKAVLRAAAGAFSDAHQDVIYFPSFEVITGQPTRMGFYGPDLRGVTQDGVNAVMSYLFPQDAPPRVAFDPDADDKDDEDDDLGYEQCDEGLLGEVARRAD